MPRRITPRRVVGERHALERHRARARRQRHGARAVLDLRLLGQELDQLLQIDESLLDRAVELAQPLHRPRQLQQVGVDQHQLAQGHGARRHPAQRHEQDRAAADGEDGGEQDAGQAAEAQGAHGEVLDPGEARIVALGDVALVAEILDRLVVQEAVDGLAVRDGSFGHGLALVGAQPFRAHDQRCGVERHRDDQDDGEDAIEPRQHDHGHEQHLGRQGQDQEHAVEQQLAGAVQALVEDPADLAGAAGQVEAQGQGVQVLQRMAREAAAGALLDRSVE